MDLKLRRGDVSFRVHRDRKDERTVFHVRRHRGADEGSGPETVLPLEVWSLGGGEFVLDTPAGPRRGYAARDGEAIWVHFSGTTFRLEIDREDARRRSTTGPSAVTSPMPGQVLRALVQVGDRVVRGQPLLVVEAMKMQIEIAAPHAGVVRELPFPAGASVEAGVRLAEVDPGTPEGPA